MFSCDVGRQLADPLLDLLERGPREPAVAVGDIDDEWHRDQCDRREIGADREHRDRGEHDRERGLEHEDQAVAEEEAHRLQIDGRARHQLAGLLAIEERQLERLQLPEQQRSQVVLDAKRHASRDETPRGREHQPDEARAGDRDGEQHESLSMVAVDRVDRSAGA